MRYFEIASGLRLPVNSEEWALIDKLKDRPTAKDDLDDRQRELARLMTSRGLLNYHRQNDRTVYRVSSATDIWRNRDDR